MLKNKIFYSLAILALCVASLASCTGGNRGNGSESNTTSGIMSDIKEGISDVESDIRDGGIGDREDATHGMKDDSKRENDFRHGDDFFRHREAVPFGK